MTFKKKHFFLLFGINLLLPVLIGVLITGHFGDNDSILAWLIAVTVTSFFFFFIGWFLHFAFTKDKNPSPGFHLISQALVTALMLFFVVYYFYSRWHYKNYEANTNHNNSFLKSPDGITSHEDTLFQKGFALLEDKMEDANDIRLNQRIKLTNKIIATANGTDTVTVFYFTYTIKDRTTTFASKHITGDHTNILLFYNIAVNALPELRTPYIRHRAETEASLTDDSVSRILDAIVKAAVDSVNKK